MTGSAHEGGGDKCVDGRVVVFPSTSPQAVKGLQLAPLTPTTSASASQACRASTLEGRLEVVVTRVTGRSPLLNPSDTGGLGYLWPRPGPSTSMELVARRRRPQEHGGEARERGYGMHG
jgi:hypothetical protein